MMGSTVLIGICFLALCLVFAFEMRHSMRRSARTNELIGQYAGTLAAPRRAELLDAIYRYTMEDWKLRRVMKKNGATMEDLEQLYRKLMTWGDFQKGRRYVPISSFFYVYTLDYLLKHRDEDAKKLTMKCMNFFHI